MTHDNEREVRFTVRADSDLFALFRATGTLNSKRYGGVPAGHLFCIGVEGEPAGRKLYSCKATFEHRDDWPFCFGKPVYASTHFQKLLTPLHQWWKPWTWGRPSLREVTHT